MARSAGASAQILAIEGRYVTLRLRSGEVRRVLSECRATIGSVSNSEHSLRSIGKALPIDRNECSELDTLPIVALHSERTLLTSPLLNLSVTYLPSIARI